MLVLRKSSVILTSSLGLWSTSHSGVCLWGQESQMLPPLRLPVYRKPLASAKSLSLPGEIDRSERTTRLATPKGPGATGRGARASTASALRTTSPRPCRRLEDGELAGRGDPTDEDRLGAAPDDALNRVHCAAVLTR